MHKLLRIGSELTWFNGVYSKFRTQTFFHIVSEIDLSVYAHSKELPYKRIRKSSQPILLLMAKVLWVLATHKPLYVYIHTYILCLQWFNFSQVHLCSSCFCPQRYRQGSSVLTRLWHLYAQVSVCQIETFHKGMSSQWQQNCLGQWFLNSSGVTIIES